MPHRYILKTAFPTESNFKIDYKKDLTDEQLPIVTAAGGPMLVIAGAGSGKTRTVTYRVAYLCESGIPLENILLLTFTNKAAREMTTRVESLLKRNLNGLWAGTFHHVGNMIMRKHAKKLGYRQNFTIMDRTDSKDLLDRSVKEAGPALAGSRNTLENIIMRRDIPTKEKKFPKGDVLQDVNSYMANSQKTLEQVIETKYPHLFEIQEEIRSVINAYEKAKMEQNLMDFDDLLTNWLKLLLEHEDVRRELSTRFFHILVDEYQDTNLVQAQIIDLLATEHRNLMVVGDDSQCLMKGTKILTPNGYKVIEDLKARDHVLSGGGNGRLVVSKVTAKRKNHHSEYLIVETKKRKRIRVSQNHLCFGRIRALTKYWYVYLMYREDLGFRIGITNLPRFQKANPRIQMRTTFEQGERLWLLEACKNRQMAQYREMILSLRYRIPQTLFCPETRARKNIATMTDDQAGAIFKEFGQSGYSLLRDYGLLFNYPTFVPKASKSKRRIVINLLMASANNQIENRQRQRHELCAESRHAGEIVKDIKGVYEHKGYWRFRKYSSNYKLLLELAEELKTKLEKHGCQVIIVYKAKFLTAAKISGSFRIIPAAGLLPGMLVPILAGKEILTDEVKSVKKVLNKKNIPFYDLEIEKSHNIISDGIITHNSIYSFRAAEFRNIIDFPKRYTDCKIFKIETNHRSTPEILDLANDSIQNATERFEKNLKPVRKSGASPAVVSFRDVFKQSAFVAQRMLELHDDGMKLSDMAVLYRSHYHCLELQMELTKRGIPYEVRSGLRLWEEAHIKDVMAHMKIFQNPYDGMSWMRVFKLIDNVGQKTAEKIWHKLQKAEKPIELVKDKSILEGISKPGQESFSRFQKLVAALEKMIENPSAMIGTIVESGYGDFLRMTYANYNNRLEELEELGNYAIEYQSLEKLLSALALAGGTSAEEIVSSGSPGEKDAVVLTTVHQAKGLEWKVVFIIWLAEGRFPSYLSFGSEKEIEEERRLFYVAVTRSKDHLYLAYPVTYQSREGMVVLKASRFIKEISEHRYEKWLIEEEGSLAEDEWAAC